MTGLTGRNGFKAKAVGLGLNRLDSSAVERYKI